MNTFPTVSEAKLKLTWLGKFAGSLSDLAFPTMLASLLLAGNRLQNKNCMKDPSYFPHTLLSREMPDRLLNFIKNAEQ